VVRILLEANASPRTERKIKGSDLRNFIRKATWAGHLEIVALLEEAYVRFS
jgi:hypothetical protein